MSVATKWIEENCECGLDRNGDWSDEVFDRFGCDCREVIQSQLASLDTAISKLDTFNEDHAGELQELLFYRDYLSDGLSQ